MTLKHLMVNWLNRWKKKKNLRKMTISAESGDVSGVTVDYISCQSGTFSLKHFLHNNIAPQSHQYHTYLGLPTAKCLA